MKGKIVLMQGDITHQEVDAIVNAANETLLGGGGVDGAIHRAAGPELLQECRALGGCATGQAKITKGYHLSAKWIIHTVGPVWHGGLRREAQLLASCYWQCLDLAVQNSIRSIAFPSVSTGVYRYPVSEASRIALQTTQQFLKEKENAFQKVVFVCFNDEVLKTYHAAFDVIFSGDK